MKRCKGDIVSWQPDVVILVDYPGFNLDIAKFVHAKVLMLSFEELYFKRKNGEKFVYISFYILDTILLPL